MMMMLNNNNDPGFDFDEDDPEILRAALDFIEACESSSDFSEEAASGDDTHPQSGDQVDDNIAAAAPKTIKRRNPRKEEIEELRKRVATLEDKLTATKRKFQPSVASDDADGSDGAINTELMWEQIAKRQQRQRYMAELENVKLRNMVSAQLKIAGDLTRVSKRQASLRVQLEPIPPQQRIEASASPALATLGGSPTRLPDLRSDSPLLVTIFPSRRSGISMSATGEEATEALLKQPSSWRSTIAAEIVRTERTQAVRLVAWQSMLRQFLNKKRVGYSYDRLGEVLESAVTPPSSYEIAGGLDARMIYTSRYLDGNEEEADSGKPTASAWKPSAAWQSPSALLSSLLRSPTDKPMSLRLFQLNKCKSSPQLDGEDVGFSDRMEPQVVFSNSPSPPPQQQRASCLSRAMTSCWQQPRSVLLASTTAPCC